MAKAAPTPELRDFASTLGHLVSNINTRHWESAWFHLNELRRELAVLQAYDGADATADAVLAKAGIKEAR